MKSSKILNRAAGAIFFFGALRNVNLAWIEWAKWVVFGPNPNLVFAVSRYFFRCFLRFEVCI
jgi:hypothetical protein